MIECMSNLALGFWGMKSFPWLDLCDLKKKKSFLPSSSVAFFPLLTPCYGQERFSGFRNSLKRYPCVDEGSSGLSGKALPGWLSHIALDMFFLFHVLPLHLPH